MIKLRRNKKKIIIIGAISLCIVTGIFCFTEPFSTYNKNIRAFEEAVLEQKEGNTITLKELTPFSWEKVYSFEPYTSKEEICQIIGFRSNRIKETVSEKMEQLIFVNNHQVICSITAYPETIGYLFQLPNSYNGQKYIELKSTENPSFQVTENQGILVFHLFNPLETEVSTTIK